MRVLLFQLDGKIPNIALMRLAAHHRALGDDVELRKTGKPEISLFDLKAMPHKVYASAIFEKTRPVVERLKDTFPTAIVGGTGVDVKTRLEDFGITTKQQDYSLYPKWPQSIGFTQRGCRLKCGFCVVPKKEGAVTEEATIYEIWRGDPWPRELILLDNDFFGQPNWRLRIAEIRDGEISRRKMRHLWEALLPLRGSLSQNRCHQGAALQSLQCRNRINGRRSGATQVGGGLSGES